MLARDGLCKWLGFVDWWCLVMIGGGGGASLWCCYVTKSWCYRIADSVVVGWVKGKKISNYYFFRIKLNFHSNKVKLVQSRKSKETLGQSTKRDHKQQS